MTRTLKNLAECLDLQTERDAAEYIFTSRLNGQHKQARDMFTALSNVEKSRLISFLRISFESDVILNALEDWLIN